MKAMHEIVPGDVCSRCGATVRPRRGPDGSLEGGLDIDAPTGVADGSLEGGVDLPPGWDCDCDDATGPAVAER
jgi:hypothetical protein